MEEIRITKKYFRWKNNILVKVNKREKSYELLN